MMIRGDKERDAAWKVLAHLPRSGHQYWIQKGKAIFISKYKKLIDMKEKKKLYSTGQYIPLKYQNVLDNTLILLLTKETCKT